MSQQSIYKKSPQKKERIYKGTQVLDHDLFKLRPAQMLKNVSWTDVPRYEPMEHGHIFHSIDSSGRKQTLCGFVGGHSHEIHLEFPADGGQPTAKVGKPVRYKIIKDEQGRTKRITVPLKHDSHTHEIEYISSEKIQLRTINPEFIKVEAQIMGTPPPPVEGIKG